MCQARQHHVQSLERQWASQWGCKDEGQEGVRGARSLGVLGAGTETLGFPSGSRREPWTACEQRAKLCPQGNMSVAARQADWEGRGWGPGGNLEVCVVQEGDAESVD